MNTEERNEKPFLETLELYKSFRHVEALRGVSIRAYGGEVLAIVGDNGAGKSTLIKILSGVLTPDSGQIKINGKEYHKLTPKKAAEEGISTVYQDLALGNTMDVASNLFLGSELSTAGCFCSGRRLKRRPEAGSRCGETCAPWRENIDFRRADGSYGAE